MDGMTLLAAGLLTALVFCTVRTVLDFRDRRFAWAWAGLAVSALLLGASLAPIKTHAVKVDPPINR